MNPSSVDNPQKRAYVQEHRLWLLGEVIAMTLMHQRPENPLDIVLGVLRSEQRKRTESVDPPPLDIVNETKVYLQAHRIPNLLEEWMRYLTESQPLNPLEWSIQYFTEVQNTRSGVGNLAFSSPTRTGDNTTVPSSRASVAPSEGIGASTMHPITQDGRRKPKVLIVFYSAYGHISQLVKAIREGVVEGSGIPMIKRFPETLSTDQAQRMQLTAADASVLECTQMDFVEADAVMFGFPTRFGNPPAQVLAMMDATGQLWANGSMTAKIGAVFTSSATQHGGQETTILNFHKTLLHHGMIVIGVDPRDLNSQTDVVEGGSPYGMSTISGAQGERQPSEGELRLSRKFGARVALTALGLVNDRRVR